MTRINCIPVEELHQKHLVAEYRELPRVFALCDKHYSARKPMIIPFNYTMGKGHVLFFYNKLAWLSNRYSALIDEMRRRGYNPSFSNDFPNRFNNLPNHYWVIGARLILIKKLIGIASIFVCLRWWRVLVNKPYPTTNTIIFYYFNNTH